MEFLEVDPGVPRKRGRPKKVDVQEEVATKRIKPMRIKIIPPRQDPDHDKVEHMSKSPSDGEARSGINEARTRDNTPTDASPVAETRRKSSMKRAQKLRRDKSRSKKTVAPGKQLEDERKNSLKEASREVRREVGREVSLCSEQKKSSFLEQVSDDKRHGIKQKRSVIRLPDNFNLYRGKYVANGHSDEAKRRKLEHVKRLSQPEADRELRTKTKQVRDHRPKIARDQEHRTKNGHDQEHRTKNAQDREHRRKKVQDQEHRMKLAQDREYRRKNTQDQEHRRKILDDKEHRRKWVEDREQRIKSVEDLDHKKKNHRDEDPKTPQKSTMYDERERATSTNPQHERVMERSKVKKKQMKRNNLAGCSTPVSNSRDGVDERQGDVLAKGAKQPSLFD